MIINGLKVYDNVEIHNIYRKAKEDKRLLIDNLFKNGYWFLANNNEMFGFAKKWSRYSPIKVLSCSGYKPRYVWAIKPIEDQS